MSEHNNNGLDITGEVFEALTKAEAIKAEAKAAKEEVFITLTRAEALAKVFEAKLAELTEAEKAHKKIYESFIKKYYIIK